MSELQCPDASQVDSVVHGLGLTRQRFFAWEMGHLPYTHWEQVYGPNWLQFWNVRMWFLKEIYPDCATHGCAWCGSVTCTSTSPPGAFTCRVIYLSIVTIAGSLGSIDTTFECVSSRIAFISIASILCLINIIPAISTNALSISSCLTLWFCQSRLDGSIRKQTHISTFALRLSSDARNLNAVCGIFAQYTDRCFSCTSQTMYWWWLPWHAAWHSVALYPNISQYKWLHSMTLRHDSSVGMTGFWHVSNSINIIHTNHRAVGSRRHISFPIFSSGRTYSEVNCGLHSINKCTTIKPYSVIHGAYSIQSDPS